MSRFILRFLLFFCGLPVGLMAGETINYNYKFVQLGGGVCQTQNTHLSPLVFQGMNVSLQQGSSRGWGQQLRTSTLLVNLNAYSHSNDESSLQGTDFSYYYNRYYRPDWGLPFGIDCYVGGGYLGFVDVLTSPDNINNALYYTFNNSLNLGFFLAKKWDEYFFSNEFSMPLIGIYSASEYASSFPYRLYHDDIPLFARTHIGSLNVNWVMMNRFNFDVIAHTKKKKMYNLRFSYTITYGRQKLNNIIYNKALHQIGVGLLFNTKHHEY